MRPIRVLVACEFSATVRDAFRALGFDAWSCDILPTEGDPTYHYQCDVREVLHLGWDLLIAHPPCTYLCISGARWFKSHPGRKYLQQDAIEFVRLLMNAPILMIAIENPIGVLSTHIRPPDQIIHPYEHGHPERKSTCLWLENLPLLRPSCICEGEVGNSIHMAPPGPDQWKIRSKTFSGIAKAMAQQWGDWLKLKLPQYESTRID
jgi:site-specific DNA-cytosine methylase